MRPKESESTFGLRHRFSWDDDDVARAVAAYLRQVHDTHLDAQSVNRDAGG